MSLKNKAVLISIRPEWCDLIVRGKKTIEVRKTRPKLETPFKVYIYCTKIPDWLRTVSHEWQRLDRKVSLSVIRFGSLRR